MAGDARIYVFTAFEQSGDAHAAPVIAAIRSMDPDARVVAWGGERMARAGAEMLGRTAEDGTMGVRALSKVFAVWRIAQEVDHFAREHKVAVHIPVDSPAANFPLCARTKGRGAKVVHLVAPQLWAWGPWRIRKLRRLTDHVICLLPFEESWFRERGVAATFVGHPVINAPDAEPVGAWSPSSEWARGEPRVLLLPGSRLHEVDRNAAVLLDCWEAIAAMHPAAVAIVCAANDGVRRRFEQMTAGRPSGRRSMVVGEIDATARWCDFAIAVSGTVSLDLTRARKPMIGVYRATALSCAIGNRVLTARDRLLPNILARRRVVPEFVPHSGSTQRVVETALRLAGDAVWRAEISRDLEGVVRLFGGHDPGPEAARVILKVAEKCACDRGGRG